MKTASDETLIRAARSGDREALEALLLRHQNRVYRFGMKLCRHPEDAEDVLQETLLAVARSIGEFEGRSSLSTWLYSLARSFCVKKRRKRKFDPPVVESLERDVSPEARALADSRRPPDEALLGREVEAALEAAIRGLDPSRREVLVLRDVEGLRAREVAKILGISVAAVKSRLHRARLEVRERVAPVLGIGRPAEGPEAAGCPEILSTYSRHLEGEISPELCAEMERHVAGCERCRGACDSLKRTLALCKALPAPQVPEPVQESVRAALRELLAEGHSLPGPHSRS